MENRSDVIDLLTWCLAALLVVGCMGAFILGLVWFLHFVGWWDLWLADYFSEKGRG